MDHLRAKLMLCPLFSNCAGDQLNRITTSNRYRTADFSKGQTLAVEGNQCRHLGIVLQGKVRVQKNYASGKVVTLTHLAAGEVFAEALLFSQRGEFPATLQAAEDNTQVMFIHQTEVIRLCESNRHFLQEFLQILSDKILSLNHKVRLLSFKTIRQKIAGYLLDEHSRQDDSVLHLPLSREDLAQHLGVPRPSVSRELSRMQDDGLLRYQGRTVELCDLDELLACLFE